MEDITGIGWKEKIQSLKRTLMETEKRLKQLEEIFERCRTLKENQEQIADQIEKLEEKERKTSQSLTESKLMYTKLEAEYQAMEEKIKAAGYPREISGQAVYEDICDQIEGKENGTYLLLSKFEEDVVFEYHITIQDEDFNLGILTMRTPEGVFETDFDAE